MPSLDPTPILWLALLIGFAFGLIVQRTGFCTMGAVADIVSMGDWSRMRQWLLAIAVAVLGSACLELAGLIDLDKSIYRASHFTWLQHLVGGFCFGSGMVLASGCGGKSLVRLGGGNLKSLVVLLVLGLSAAISMHGLLAVLRVRLLEPFALELPGGQGLPNLLGRAFGLAPQAALIWAAGLVGGGLLLFVLCRRDFWKTENFVAGVGVGLAVLAGWYVSGHLGHLAEHPETLEEAFLATNSGRMESLTFVAPTAYTLEWLMFWSDSSRSMSFGIASLLGVIAGAGAQALFTRRFRWEGFAGAADTGRHLLGAVLMGFGGVTALGCSIGQGITGFSTLSLGAFCSFAAIVLGAWCTLKYQYWRLMRA